MDTHTQPPVPRKLAEKWGDDPPRRLKTYTVAMLLEHWGFTDNGVAYVKKLVRCGALVNVMKPGNDWRFDTGAVLQLWKEMQR